MPGRDTPVWVSPLPPVPSGISQYSRDLLLALDSLWDLMVLLEPGSSSLPGSGFNEVSYQAAAKTAYRVLQTGNSGFHQHAFTLAHRPDNVLVLHDVVLHHARLADHVARGRPREYVRLMADLYGAEGEFAANEVLRGTQVDLTRFPLSEDLITAARLVVVHSKFARDQVLGMAPDARVSVVPMGVPLPAEVDRLDARQALGIDPEVFLVSSITHVNPMKRIPVVLRALRRVVERVPSARVVIAGSVSAGMDLERQIELLGLGRYVTTRGYVPDSEARMLASASDVCVNLRYPSTGETSASLLRLLGAGIPVVVSAHGSLCEVPEDAAIHLPVDRLEEETLAEYLVWLANDPVAREEYGAAARRFVQTRHSMRAAIEGYREAFRDAWGIHLPSFDGNDIEEARPILSPPVQTGPIVTSVEPFHQMLAHSLVQTGLAGHDGTIEAIASKLTALGLKPSSRGIAMDDYADRQVDPDLLEILACPVCKVRVRLAEQELICDRCGRHYRIENGIPIMLVDETS